MRLRVEELAGIERLKAATVVLQRARRAAPRREAWEAADVQWWWRQPRASDDVALPVWFDDAGPIAAVGLTAWRHSWQVDIHRHPAVELHDVWVAALAAIKQHVPADAVMPVGDGDAELTAAVVGAGFRPTANASTSCWMRSEDRPSVSKLAGGFAIVDRAARKEEPHPMRARNGSNVEARLRQCSLYEPALDLSVECADGRCAGYALFWFDDSTGVGMIEPMRVEDEFQRRGIARALLTEGLDRLSLRGASTFKVGFETNAARDLYVSSGFVPATVLRSYELVRR